MSKTTMATIPHLDEVVRQNCKWVACDLRHIVLTLQGTEKWASIVDRKRLAAMRRELEAMAARYETKASK